MSDPFHCSSLSVDVCERACRHPRRPPRRWELHVIHVIYHTRASCTVSHGAIIGTLVYYVSLSPLALSPPHPQAWPQGAPAVHPVPREVALRSGHGFLVSTSAGSRRRSQTPRRVTACRCAVAHVHVSFLRATLSLTHAHTPPLLHTLRTVSPFALSWSRGPTHTELVAILPRLLVISSAEVYAVESIDIHHHPERGPVRRRTTPLDSGWRVHGAY